MTSRVQGEGPARPTGQQAEPSSTRPPTPPGRSEAAGALQPSAEQYRANRQTFAREVYAERANLRATQPETTRRDTIARLRARADALHLSPADTQAGIRSGYGPGAANVQRFNNDWGDGPRKHQKVPE